MSAAKPGALIAVHGAKGGVGATTVACNLALALRRLTHQEVALLDGEPHFGGVPTIMGLSHNESWVRHASGVLVAAPASSGLDLLVDEARRRAEWVIVDTPALLTRPSIRVLQRSQAVLLVITPEETAARHARAFLDLCADEDLASDVRIVVNRSGSASGLTAGRLDEMFGPRLIAHVDSDGPMVVNAINTGQPFVYALPEHRLSVQLGGLAHTLAGV